MEAAPRPRGAHAWKWLLGMTFAMVVASAMGLQAARRRADERWDNLIVYCYKEIASKHVGWIPPASGPFPLYPGTHGGNILRAWRVAEWNCGTYLITLRQARNFFGSNVEAHIYGYSFLPPPERVAAVRAILAAVDVELVVEP